MSTENFALCWELGFGTSYISFMRLLAEEIRLSGGQSTVFAKDLVVAARLKGEESVKLVPAPLPPSCVLQREFIQTSYASLLFVNGYSDKKDLLRRVERWIALYQENRIDVVVARHSPTAILAADALGLPCVHFGNGFSIPPPQTPWPSFRPDMKVEERALSENEGVVLGHINFVRQRLGCKALPSLAELFSPSSTLLLDYPELDSWAGFRERRGMAVEYLGFPDINFGSKPIWPNKREIKVFLSLLETSDLSWVNAIVDAGAEVIVRTRGGAKGGAVPLQSEYAAVLDQDSLSFSEVIDQCDFVVGYGSHNLVCEALLQGKPIGVIRHSADELLLGQRVEMLGVGVSMGSVPDAITKGKLRKLWPQNCCREAAEFFKTRYASDDRGAIPSRVVQAARNLLLKK